MRDTTVGSWSSFTADAPHLRAALSGPKVGDAISHVTCRGAAPDGGVILSAASAQWGDLLSCAASSLFADSGQELVYHSRMPKPKKAEAFELACPHCNATLKVDPETRAVIAHTAPVTPKTFNDFEEAAKAMREQDSRKESIFRQSVEAQKHSSDLLEKKFQEALKRAKDSPDEPRKIRDFDLD